MHIHIRGGGGTVDAFILLKINKWIYSFHMPLFFFISGFLQNISDERNGLVCLAVKKKIIALIVPYILFSVVFWLFKIIFSKRLLNPLGVKDLLLIWLYPLGDMWFLYALCLMFVIHGLIFKVKIDERIVFIITIAISLISISIDWNDNLAYSIIPRLCTNIVYYEGGYFAAKYLRSNREYSKKYSLIIGSLFVVLGIVLVYIDVPIPALMSIAGIIAAYCGVLGICFLSQLYDGKAFQFLGTNSLYIYLVHDYAVCGTVIVLWSIAHLSFIILVLAASSIGMAFSLVVVFACRKLKILNNLFKPQLLVEK